MWKNLFLTSLVIIILCLLFEGIARIIFDPPLYNFDETLGFVPKPGTVSVHKSDAFKAVYHINKLGYRGEVCDKIKKPDMFRIVLIGDSNGFGWGVQDSETFSEQVNQRSRNVEIINLSVMGYGTDQEFLRLKKEGLSYQPDLVIIQVTGNDFTEIKRPSMYGRAKPFFILKDGRLILENVPVKSSCDSTMESYIACFPLPYSDWLQHNSRAYRVLNICYLRLNVWLNSTLRRVTGHQQSVSNGKEDLSKIDENAIELFKAIIDEMHMELKNKDIKGVVVHWDEYLSESGKINNLNMPVIDLYPYLFLQDHKDIQIPKDWHFNKRGHSLIADGLLTALIKNNLLPVEHR